MLRGFLLLLTAATIALLPTASFAAEVGFPESGRCKLTINGEIITGDYEKILSSIDKFIVDDGESSGKTIACLNSPGGNYYEGLKIAKLFYEKGVGTFIDNRNVCFSSCAIIFMMGRAVGDEVSYINRTLHIGGHLGFHRPYSTLNDVRNYTSGNINAAFDIGVQGVLDMVRLATKPVPWGSEQMIPADMLQVILATPPNRIYQIRKVEEVVRWKINIEGSQPIVQPDKPNLLFACEHALTASYRRPSAIYENGLMTRDIFALSPRSEYAVKAALGNEGPYDRAYDPYFIPNLRSGYSNVACGADLSSENIGICGIDESIDTTVGDCNRKEFRFWDRIILRHPQTHLAALELNGSSKSHASRITRCRVANSAGRTTDDEPCLQEVILIADGETGLARHIFTWPSGARTVIDIAAEAFKSSPPPAKITVNGKRAAAVKNSDDQTCVKNTGTGNSFCADVEN